MSVVVWWLGRSGRVVPPASFLPRIVLTQPLHFQALAGPWAR
jgi:hypothetical protein